MTAEKYVRWDEPEVEYGAGKEEDEVINEISRQINTAQKAHWEEHRHAFSGTHVKTHAIVKGELEVLPDLPPQLAQGFFSHPGKYPIGLRHSTETTALIDDRVRQPRGLGIKVFNVEGEKLRQDGKDPKTQDFEFNSSPTLELGNARTCRDIIGLRLQHGGCPADLDAALKKRDDYEVQDSRNRIPTIPLFSQRQYSQSAFRYGDYVAKFALIPATEAGGGKCPVAQVQDKDKELTAADGPHAYKSYTTDFYAHHEAVYDFQVQLLEREFFDSNGKGDLIEDARIDWPQDKYPYITVAKVRIPPQDAFSHRRVAFWENEIRVDPWHGLKVHKPLGSINRVRKGVYKASSAFRRRLNNTHEVTVSSVDDIPD